MRRFLLATAVVATTLSSSTLVQAQTRPSSLETDTAIVQRIAFSDEDRIIMRRYVRPRLGFGLTTVAEGGVSAGARIPDAIEVRAFPRAVICESRHLRAYRYIRAGGRAYVVDPRSRVVIEEIG
jgi:hypothetical protein